ncbi:MAG: HlyD family efflux transporter periplasmic adaptor subunit [Bacteroidota bacterium]
MNRRKIIISAVGIIILVGAVALAGNMRGADTPTAEEESSQAPATVVKVLLTEQGEVTRTLAITGRVVAAEQINLFSEVQGVASYGARPFKAGNGFRKGEVLLRIDSRELRSSLAASKSQFMAALAQVLPDLKVDFTEQAPAWEAYLLGLDVEKPLPTLPTVEDQQLKLFLTGRNVYANYYSIRERETRLGKYTLTAPFTGYLSQANVNAASLVSPGQSLGEFIRAGAYELEASVPLNQLKFLEEGAEVPFMDVNTGAQYVGKLARVNPKVDATSQLVTVYFVLYSNDLRSGQYLEGELEGTAYEAVTQLPAEVLVGENSVFVVEGGVATKQPVEVLYITNGEAVVKGLPAGTQVVAEAKNAAFEGTSVLVNED